MTAIVAWWAGCADVGPGAAAHAVPPPDWGTAPGAVHPDASTPPRPTQPRTDPLTDLPVYEVPARAGAPSRGPQDAPLQVVVFTDFQCPFCRRHAADLDALIEHYGDRLRLTIRQFPLPFHDMAHRAAEAALAANAEGKFWKYHDLLFAAAGSGSLTEQTFVDLAQRAGLDMSRFQRAMGSGFFAGIVDKDIRDGASVGVEGTPCTFINGRMISGAVGPERLIEICDRLLGGAPPAAPAEPPPPVDPPPPAP